LPLAYLGLSFAFGYQFYSMTPFGGSAYWMFSGAFGVALLLSYVADRYLLTRLPLLAGSLAFPLTLVLSELLVSFGPYGTWGSNAYSQYEDLVLLQVLSLTGLYAISFLIGWFASVPTVLASRI
jgi:apolipoprotein N-acyltransferase